MSNNHRITYIIVAGGLAGAVLIGFYFFMSGPPVSGRAPLEIPSLTGGVSLTDVSADSSSAATEPPVQEREAVASANREAVVAVMKTNFGDITVELFPGEAPRTIENFIKLSRKGFYSGVKFHRVIKGFMIQGGDPKSKDDDWSDDGTGGPGYVFEDEINEHKLVRGTFAMANAGPNTNGSQFFIVTAEATPWLDGKHTVFGRVVAGMETVDTIENLPTDKMRGDHPTKDALITSIEILGE